MSISDGHLREPNILYPSRTAQWSTKTCNSLQLVTNLANLLFEHGGHMPWVP